jgi:peptide/nickel transport system substrate-binding protein
MRRSALFRAALASLLLCAVQARAGGVLKVAMTAGDLPITIGQADQGYEGFRFVSYSLYDTLIEWDLSSADKPTGIVPGLAESWNVDPEDHTRWILHLRSGVKWTDGTPFTADDVVWNFARLFDKTAPQFNAQQSGDAKGHLLDYKGIEKIDDHTVALLTNKPEALVPFQLAWISIVSPAQFKRLGSWDAFGTQPIGTGPYKLDKIVPHERMEFVPNLDYWNKARIPHQDRLIIYPMPEATTRAAALLSGQVNWIEAPPPDMVPKLKASGFDVITNAYPHIWAYELSYRDDSPFKDLRVRKAANLAVDRAGLKEMLGGMMNESYGNVMRDDPWYGHPTFDIKYDPAAAKALMKEAGYDKDHPAHVRIAISTAGSGQMQPLPMNEFVQQNLNDVGFDVQFDVMDWNALIGFMRAGASGPVAVKNHDVAINFSRTTQDPYNAICRFAMTNEKTPPGSNWGGFSDPKIDEVCTAAMKEFDPAKRDALFAQAQALMVDNAVLVWIAHDVNPRALSPKVHGFVQAKNWFQDLTPVSVDP